MLFKRSPSPSLSSGSVRSRSGWVKLTVAGLSAALIIGSLVAWRASSAKKEEKKPDTEITLEFAPADLTIAENRELSRTLPFSGTLSPVIQSTVKSKVSGEVRLVMAREGERVNQGQVLAQIDTSDLQARLDAQVAALEEAKARWSIADKNRESNLKLLKQNFISQNAFDTTNSTFDASAASVRSAEAQVRLARNAMQDAVVRAPISGILARKMVNGGEKVGPDSPMFTVVDLAKMEIEAPAPASEIPGVKVGQTASFKVDGFSDRVFEGRVERINPVTEQGSRSITLYLSVANRDGALKGGMFAKGLLVLAKTQPTTVVPFAAIRDDTGQSYVFTLESGKIAKRNVTLGMREEQAGLVEVKSGLESGVKVVSARMVGLKAGATAVVKLPASTPAAPVPAVKAS
ncbi:MAG: efflux RND transporter periplasmic adaptor subunit [Betaproteobacteria bacterium]